jgi:hypothetical protein
VRIGGETGQRLRLLWASAYTAGFVPVAIITAGSFPPDPGIKGIWFYSAFAALVLGEFVVEPFYAVPADGVTNGVTLLLAGVATSADGAEVSTATFDAGRLGICVYAALVIAISIAAILLKDGSTPFGPFAASLVRSLGRAGTVFSIAFFASAYAGYAQHADKLAILGVAWLTVFAARPLEHIEAWVRYWRNQPRRSALGRVDAIEDPSVAVVSFAGASTPSVGDDVAVGRAGCQGTVVEVTRSLSAPRGRVLLTTPAHVGDVVTSTARHRDSSLVGFTMEGTDLAHVTFHLSAGGDEPKLQQGHVVQASVMGVSVLFQIIGAQIRVRHDMSLTQRPIEVIARQLGTWHGDAFEAAPWLPAAGTAVYRLAMTGAGFDVEATGVIPGTNYGVKVDMSLAVTHNTAILGILGIGKTCLAWELIERSLRARIKVVVLDVTERYSIHFSQDTPGSASQVATDRIVAALRKNEANDTVRVGDAGNQDDFKKVLDDTLRGFFAEEGSQLLILNPNRFPVTRMEGKPFSNRAQLLVRLTPAELTRLTAEALLSIAQATTPAADDGAMGARICLVVEEGHVLVPEWNTVASDADKQASNGTARAIMQGRKFGFGCIVLSQRTANIAKSLLNQCNTVFAMRMYDATGIEFLANYLGPEYSGLLNTLEDRHAVVFGRASSCRVPAIIRLNDIHEFSRAYDRWRQLPSEVESVPTAAALASPRAAPDEGGSDVIEADDIPF